jgi:hypothetical protein
MTALSVRHFITCDFHQNVLLEWESLEEEAAAFPLEVVVMTWTTRMYRQLMCSCGCPASPAFFN